MRNFCSTSNAAFLSTTVSCPENPLDVSNVLPLVKEKLALALEVRLSDLDAYWVHFWDDSFHSKLTLSEDAVIRQLINFYLSCFEIGADNCSVCRSFQYSNLNTGFCLTWTFVVVCS